MPAGCPPLPGGSPGPIPYSLYDQPGYLPGYPQTAPPRPAPRPAPRDERPKPVLIPGPDELGIRLPERAAVPPPGQLGIELK